LCGWRDGGKEDNYTMNGRERENEDRQSLERRMNREKRGGREGKKLAADGLIFMEGRRSKNGQMHTVLGWRSDRK
jgi:hypothetical protein